MRTCEGNSQQKGYVRKLKYIHSVRYRTVSLRSKPIGRPQTFHVLQRSAEGVTAHCERQK